MARRIQWCSAETTSSGSVATEYAFMLLARLFQNAVLRHGAGDRLRGPSPLHISQSLLVSLSPLHIGLSRASLWKICGTAFE